MSNKDYKAFMEYMLEENEVEDLLDLEISDYEHEDITSMFELA